MSIEATEAAATEARAPAGRASAGACGRAGAWARELEAVVFDLDGVLVDSRRPIAACMNAALADLGLAEEPEARLHRFIGPPLREAFLELLRVRGAPEAWAAACIDGYRAHYREASLRWTTAFPGVPELLEGLARTGRRLAVATSKPEVFARPILERLGLAGRFEVIAGPGLERTHEEDKTATLGRALRALGAGGAARRAAMVGDRWMDVRAGRHHGLFTVGATWGIGSAAELREAGADLLAESAEALARSLGADRHAAAGSRGAAGADRSV